MISEEQAKDIMERIKLEALIFVESEYKKSDKEIADELLDMGVVTSSSTVGRDLTSKKLKELIGDDNYDTIQKHRKENQLKGRSLGGKNSQENNGYSKDELGHFTGPRK